MVDRPKQAARTSQRRRFGLSLPLGKILSAWSGRLCESRDLVSILSASTVRSRRACGPASLMSSMQWSVRGFGAGAERTRTREARGVR
jgi:hypothetical protein